MIQIQKESIDGILRNEPEGGNLAVIGSIALKIISQAP